MRKTDIFCYKDKEENLRNYYLINSYQYDLAFPTSSVKSITLWFSDFLANLVHMSPLWPLEGLALFQHQNAMALC